MRCLPVALLLFAVLGLAPPGSAQVPALPTLDALQTRVAAAQGTQPASSYERRTYSRFGAAGSSTILRSGDDFRQTDSSGRLTRAHGSYHKQAWHQNANGQTVLDQPDPGAAVEDRYTTTVSRVSAPFDAYVIARLNAAGGGSKDYVDPVSARIVRREAIEPTQTTVTTYDDFRTVAGYTRPWHWTVRDGHPENDAEYRIETFVSRPVDGAEIEIAPPRRALVEFPAGRSSVELPVKLVLDKFVVRVTIAGRGLDFILDSGAGGISLDENVARQLGLAPVAQSSNAVNAGRIRESTVIVPEMGVGDLRMHDVVVEAIPFSEDLPDTKVVGLLGFDFIAESLLKLDYEHGRVTALASTDLQIEPRNGTIVLDVRLGSQIPLTTVTVNGARGERFIVDTGNAAGVILFDYFARRYPRALVDHGGSPPPRRLTGVGGPIDVRSYRLQAVTLGNVTFEDFVADRVMERRSYEGNLDGAIGVDELRIFTVWLDYANSRIVMVPNTEGRRAMK